MQLPEIIKNNLLRAGSEPDARLSVTRANDYRPDIDGLRAIAVLAVLLFHAFPSLLQGGFVGVDIFFVISGYLISKHIWEELAAGTYSIKVFYARRVRRIFPALSLVMFACLLAGWVILSPAEYEQLATHVRAGTLFVSNLVFWKEAGYFDNAADTKPLLHLWSLGIEEQFYIVWPLLLAFFWRNTRFFAAGFLLVLGASLIYSIFVVQHDVVADFYSPFTRFWELAIGAAVAYAISSRYALNELQRTLLAWLGLVLIIFAATVVQKHFLFPGAWALLPTLGAASLIYAGAQSWPNRHLLSQPALVWVGLISYPLYLWHWPLLSFARIIESETPPVGVRIILLAVSVLLAWLTYKLLECKIRSRPRTMSLVLVLCCVMLLLTAAGEAIRKLDGVHTRNLSMLNADPDSLVLGADRDKLQPQCGLSEAQKPLFQYCLRSRSEPIAALLGDSKAEALFYGLVRETPMAWTMIGSVQPPDTNVALADEQQIKNRSALQAIIQDKSVRVVAWVVTVNSIFSINPETGLIANDRIPDEKISAYSLAIQQLEQSGKRVIFVIDNPTFPDPRSCISGGATGSPFFNRYLRRKENPRCSMAYSDYLAGMRLYFDFTKKLQQLNPNLAVYDPTALLCDTGHNRCSVTQGNKFLYSYGNHISDYANSKIARDMLPMIENLMR
jgi:peptidoglycan/LPS O-acetylase OafA/YrhL